MNIPTENLSLIKFIEQFHSEELCVSYLFFLRYGNTYECLKCGNQRFSPITTRPHQYYCLTCKTQFSVLTKTLFENTKIPLHKWFLAIFLMVRDKRGISALTLSRELDLHRNTTMPMLHELRMLMAERDRAYKLYGLIEMDEFFIGAPSHVQGRGTTKNKVIIALSYQNITTNGQNDEFEDTYQDSTSEVLSERSEIDIEVPMYCKMLVVDALDSRTINQFVKDKIMSGSTIITDSYRGYNKLLELEINHQIEDFSSDEIRYKYLHIVISNLKSYVLGTYHGLGGENLQVFLDEFCYRFNRRKMHESLFDRLLKLAVNNDKG
jgi:transposase-like protein